MQVVQQESKLAIKRKSSIAQKLGSLYSRKTLIQMLGYGVVGVVEYAVGWGIISSLSQVYHIPLFISFTVQFVIVGYFIGFLLRKFWVFKA